ncbi:tetratricopeptide repeat protein [Micromonospora halotolerans]|uniref:Tetratricopeptide repeat protein n=1 Tax=Micromonospora halotolerans TaxID=709879 RepID=A0ABY9ZVN1_9ACTN|nr:tetratricopeptide repeat protein [Micromonospora halotolerans]WNM39239.1 tetratricopeptide repeat protein [Micromonospora halotolerans]
MTGQQDKSLLGELRRVAGLTQEELAERTGLTVRGISNIERGRVPRPRRRSVEALAVGLGLRGDQVHQFVRHYCPEATRLPAPGAAVVPAPAQLPAASSSFTGREPELDRLDALCAQRGQGVVVAVLEGMAGVGKTSLALHWAQLRRADFPDGQLFANLRGYGPGTAAEPSEVLRSFLRAFDVPAAEVPADLDERSALLRSVLATRSVLLVLDNARSAEQVRPLLPGHPGCVVVVTSRTMLHGLTISNDAHRVTVPLFTDVESRSLFGRLAGAARLGTDQADVADVVSGCGGLPLALRIVAERLGHERELSELAAAMRSAGDRLDALTTEEERTSLPAVLSWSYRTLPRDVADAFRLLGLHPGPHWEPAAAAALLGVRVPEARRLLHLLVEGHLLERRADGRYEFHDLVRDYARGLAGAAPRNRWCEPVRRLAEHCLTRAVAAAELIAPPDPNRRPLLTPVTAVDRSFAGPEDAAAWLATELPTLLAVAEQSAGMRQAEGTSYARDLSTVLWQALRVHGHYSVLRTLHGLALAEARAAADAVGVQQALVDLATVCARLGHYDEAVEHLTECLAVDGSPAVAGRAYNILGVVQAQLGRYEPAARHLRQAVALARETADSLNEGRSLSNLGFLHERQGELDAALRCYADCLTIAQAHGDRPSEAIALHNLGDVYRALGHYQAARKHLDRSLAVSRAVGHREAEGYALAYLGLVHLHLGDPGTARRYQEAALAIAVETGIRPLETLANNGLGDIARASGNRPAALAHYLRACDLARLTQEPHEEARALDGIAATYDDAGDQAKGAPYRRHARSLYEAMGVTAGQAGSGVRR